jgi:hypothetical protein
VADFTLQILCKQRDVLIHQLEQAKQHRRHDDITPIAAELSQTRARISARVKGVDALPRLD